MISISKIPEGIDVMNVVEEMGNYGEIQEVVLSGISPLSLFVIYQEEQDLQKVWKNYDLHRIQEKIMLEFPCPPPECNGSSYKK